MKKIVFLFLIVVLGLASASFFYWQQNQADTQELNKNLPEGVKVVKSLFKDEYKVVNKIDGYEFKIPPEWQGIKEIEYIPERTEEGYIAASISAEGKAGLGGIVTVDQFKIEDPATVDLEFWAETNFETFGLVGDFGKDKVGEFDIVNTEEKVHLLGMDVYFFKKDSVIYAITSPLEEFIRYIITNGKW